MFRKRKNEKNTPPSPQTMPHAPNNSQESNQTITIKPNTSLEKTVMNRPNPILANARSLSSGALQRQDASHRKTLIVGQGIRVNGTIQDVEQLIVEGTVETPAIKAKELIVAVNGTFTGEVDAQDVEISGVIDGSLTVQGSLTITATGRLSGKARCRRLKIEDGGQVTGHIEMITSEKLKPSSHSSTHLEENIVEKTDVDESPLSIDDVLTQASLHQS